MIQRLSFIDYLALNPFIIILFAALFIILTESFAPNWSKRFSVFIASFSLVLALIGAFFITKSNNPLITPWLKFDFLSRLFSFVFIAITLVTILISVPFFKRFPTSQSEFYFLLLSALFGLLLITFSADFLILFLGIETLSISLYVLCAYMKKWKTTAESGLKYVLMGSLTTGFLLYGIALMYGATGTTQFSALFDGYHNLSMNSEKLLFFCGISLVTLALAFEATIVPFQFWAPDVYEGAPTPVTAFMAVGTKLGAFMGFIRIFFEALPSFNMMFNQILSLLAIITLIYANFVAIQQSQLRRFFAYSGISHAGFLLIPLITGGEEALLGIIFYLLVYAFATLGCFAVISHLDESEEGVTLNNLKGFFKKTPFYATMFALFLLTLAGIPPTAGFIAKLLIFKPAWHSGYYGLVVVGLLTTILSAYYYLRIIYVMMQTEEIMSKKNQTIPLTIVGIISSISIVLISIDPQLLINFIEKF